MKGLLVLPQDIYCHSELLGKVIRTCIDGIEVSIHFPRFDIQTLENESISNLTLNAPDIMSNIRKEGYINWGTLINISQRNFCNSSLALSINCDENEEEGIASNIYSKIDSWTSDFIDYCILETKQGVFQNKNVLQNKTQIQLLGCKGYIPRHQRITIYSEIPDDNHLLTQKQIEDAILFASSQKELKLEYQLLLSSYSAIVLCKYKHAIIDACSALEYVLDEKIFKYAQEKNINGKIFTSKYRSLGDKFKLIKLIDNSCQGFNTKKIVDLRNDIAHNRKNEITITDANDLIIEVNKIIQHYSPNYY